MALKPADEALLKFLEKRGCFSTQARTPVEELMRAQNLCAVEALCDGGFVEESAVVDAFLTGLRLPRAELNDFLPPLSKPLDPETQKRHLMVAAGLDSGRLVLAMVNPLDQEAIRKARFASGLPVVAAVAPLSEIRAALENHALQAPGENVFSLAPAEPDPSEMAAVETDPHHPVVRMASLILVKGVISRASDVHLEPTADGLSVRYRIDGVLEEAVKLPLAVRTTLTARFKVMAGLDIAERRVPQDGRVSFLEGGRRIDGRVSTLPTQYGEKVVIRLLDAQRALVDLDQLGFEPWERQQVDECLQRPEGMILITGPTGSGKSTTLYSMIRAVQTPGVNIVTVENPIEYRLPGITQTEINERQGLTFANVLRSVLRQDPDVVLIGEIRDRETAEIAIQAAQTGHLVLSTLHTNDAVAAVIRLVNLGIDRELIASSLLLVIAQRLLRLLCPQCKTLVPEEARASLPLHEAWGDAPVMSGKGCPSCRNTGYRGRTGIYEVFRNTLEARRLIQGGATEVELRDLLRRQGGRLLMQVALDKVRGGLTAPEEVRSAVRPEEGVNLCPGCHRRVEQRFRSCPFCGAHLRLECVVCRAPLQEGWERCPDCGTTCVHEIAHEPKAAARGSGKTHSLTLTAPADLSSPSLLAAGLRGVCVAGGLDDAAAAQIESAVIEACNLAASSTPEGIQCEIKLEVEISPDGCRVCVSGQGPPWPWPRPSANLPDLDAFASGSSPEVRAFLIRSSADEAIYERADQTNRIWLIKRPSEPAQDRPAPLGADTATTGSLWESASRH
jgi:type IV pilus assembly protein PilB